MIVNLLKLLLSNNLVNVIVVSSDFDHEKHELKIGLFGERDMEWCEENDLLTLQENMISLSKKQKKA